MKDMIERLEAALGDAHDPVKVALVAGDVRELIAAHKEAVAKAEGMEEVVVLKMAERDVAEAKFKALHEAAGALLEALPFDGNTCVGRSHERMTIATKICRLAPPFAGVWLACDECAANPPADLPTKEASDLRSAPALRALRALLESKAARLSTPEETYR